MFKEFNGREWSTEELYLENQKNIKEYMSIFMALENYAACSGDETIYADDAYATLKEYKQNKETMNENDLLKTTKHIVEKFKKLLDKIGRDKFTFYDDNTVNFNWTK